MAAWLGRLPGRRPRCKRRPSACDARRCSWRHRVQVPSGDATKETRPAHDWMEARSLQSGCAMMPTSNPRLRERAQSWRRQRTGDRRRRLGDDQDVQSSHPRAVISAREAGRKPAPRRRVRWRGGHKRAQNGAGPSDPQTGGSSRIPATPAGTSLRPASVWFSWLANLDPARRAACRCFCREWEGSRDSGMNTAPRAGRVPPRLRASA
jgi:hypothetical protein